MNDSSQAASAMPPAPAARVSIAAMVPRGFWLALGLLLLGFALPLYHLGCFALGSDLYSHILLIPLVSLHALWSGRAAFRIADEPYSKLTASAFLLLGTAVAVLHFVLQTPAPNAAAENVLAGDMLAFALLLTGTCLWFFGKTAMGALLFPLLILIFTIPIPTALLQRIELLMQYGSAVVAHQLFNLSGTAVFRDDLVFQLPGISLHVAPECSGIRSTLVLLIVSAVTSHLFLRRPGHRLLLVLVVLPLALLRNGFRIFVVGELCVHYGPQMIESFLHRRGGPFFFGLSLIPFFTLMIFLQKRDRRAGTA